MRVKFWVELDGRHRVEGIWEVEDEDVRGKTKTQLLFYIAALRQTFLERHIDYGHEIVEPVREEEIREPL